MNKAESRKIADYLELVGYDSTSKPQEADLIVLNTCVVRQSAENKVLGMLTYLKGIKRNNPNLTILVTGCFVNSTIDELKRRFNHINLFFKPGDYQELLNWAQEQKTDPSQKEMVKTHQSNNVEITAFVPIIQGCNNFCSYCIVPYRRGREKSRPLEEIVNEATDLVANGVKEITLLGQNVNSYGHDLPSHPYLNKLLEALNSIDGLARIRFLTNHPKDMNPELIESIAYLDKVCEHITLPLQSGDNETLKKMKRDYTAEQYCHLIDTIRSHISEVALSTDIIVGFPGETEEQFTNTLALIEKIRFNTVHIAAYSPRQGTSAAREFEDNISAETKKERFEKIENIQTQISSEINSQLQSKSVEVLVEGKKRGKWYGRTRSDRLVFFGGEGNYLGKLVDIIINKTSPWSLQGEIKN
jgi:tRNA-2-methylthio-N6-dimethylallyladenosine synthase